MNSHDSSVGNRLVTPPYSVCIAMSTGTVILNCARIREPGVATIDYIARVKLGLQRSGRELRLGSPSTELLELLELCGLRDLLRVEVQRQPEERKEIGGVEEEGDLG